MNIQLINQTNCNSVYDINGHTVLIWTIVGGQIATSLANYKQTARWNHIPDDKTTMDSPEISWIENQTKFENWFKNALIVQAELDERPRLTFRQAFKTSAGEILIVNVKLENYVSITADLIYPISEEQAIEENDNLIEELKYEEPDYDNSEYFGTTEFFDNSLYYNDIEFNGDYYIFGAVACGCLHSEIGCLNDPKFNTLIELHLKHDKESFYKAVDIVRNFPENDLDEDVEKFAIEILS